MPRHTAPRALALPAFLVLGALATGCTEPEAPAALDSRVLYGFDGCDDLLGYTKEQAKGLIDKYGNLHGYNYSDGWWGEDAAGSTGAAGTEGGDSAGDPGGDGEAPNEGGGGVEGEDYSGTNVQEAGVDEPDIIKT